MEIHIKGSVKTILRDFGFIQVNSLKSDYFFHKSNVENFSELKEGDLISCYLRINKRTNKTEAFDIKKLRNIEKDIINSISKVKKVNKASIEFIKTSNSSISKKNNSLIWNDNIVPKEYKSRIINLINNGEIFDASQEYLNFAYKNGQKNLSKIMDEFEKIIENLEK